MPIMSFKALADFENFQNLDRLFPSSSHCLTPSRKMAMSFILISIYYTCVS